MTSAALAFAAGLLFPVSAAPAAPAAPAELSAEFAVPVEQVGRLHDRDKLSYAEIRTALILSRETGLSLDEIAALHGAGVSLDDIAARHRLDLDEVVADYETSRTKREREPPSREAVRSTPKSGPVSRPPLRAPSPPEPSGVPGEPEERPSWDSPSNPFVQQRWNDQSHWRLDRARPGFPAEQLDDDLERTQR
ncbi:MAG: hypothetical protein HY925_07220 [Elusimicrobia bacterium]|nr:hypothetical protein [Elusimicrobiota bacterium]